MNNDDYEFFTYSRKYISSTSRTFVQVAFLSWHFMSHLSVQILWYRLTLATCVALIDVDCRRWDVWLENINVRLGNIAFWQAWLSEVCTHVHISVTKWCIVGYGTGALLDLCNLSYWVFTASVYRIQYAHYCWALFFLRPTISTPPLCNTSSKNLTYTSLRSSSNFTIKNIIWNFDTSVVEHVPQPTPHILHFNLVHATYY